MKKFLAKWRPMATTVATVFLSAGVTAYVADGYKLDVKTVAIAGLAGVLTWLVNYLNPGYGAYGLSWQDRKV